MKSYTPYLLFQLARFGALSVPQMIRLCKDKCKRSTLYRALGELVDDGLVYPVINPATRTRAYQATETGRRFVFGEDQPLTPGVRAHELDHTLACAEVLLNLCQYENITGISTQFELSPEDFRGFCHERIPDGIIRLTQNGEHYELAVEVEASVRNMSRISRVLDRYLETFKKGMECTGLLLVALDETVEKMYAKALERKTPEFQSRVRIVRGVGLDGIRTGAFGKYVPGVGNCLDLSRTSFMDEIKYSPIKSSLYLSMPACVSQISEEQDSKNKLEVFS